MTDPKMPVTDQLRLLGQAMEDGTTPVTAEQVLRAGTPIDTERVVELPQGQKRRRMLPLAVAAAAVALAIASFTAITRTEPTLDTAAGLRAGQTDRAHSFALEDDNGWEELRQCESGGDYGTDTGNGFYGGYQFTPGTWNEFLDFLGEEGSPDVNPAMAEAEVQDLAAAAIYQLRGAEAWPVCGSSLTGPLLTPAISEWTLHSKRVFETRVFMDPAASGRQISSVEFELQREFGDAFDDVVRFVNKEEAHEEFQAMDLRAEEIASVSIEDMPSSFRVTGPISAEARSRLLEIDGVFELIPIDDFFNRTAMKLAIPSLGVTAPLAGDASAPSLANGAGIMSRLIGAIAIGGHGSEPQTVFARIGELEVGDIVEITELVEPRVDISRQQRPRTELTHTYRVERGPQVLDLDEIGPLQSPDGTWLQGEESVVLVATTSGDPDDRLLVSLRGVDPDLSGYGLEPGN